VTNPVSLDDVRVAHARIGRHLRPTPLRRYGTLDTWVGRGIRVYVKHENMQPTNAFKVRNAVAALTALDEAARRRGVIAATRGNHGLGLAWAGRLVGAPVVICVPRGNNPEKNAAVRALGAELVEEGADYDESLEVAARLAEARGLSVVHSTNDRWVVAGAGTIALEMLEGEVDGEGRVDLDALVFATGGGSQAVGAMAVRDGLGLTLPIYAVSAAGAPALCDAWHAKRPGTAPRADTIADGLATRQTYALTFPALLDGLTGFVKVGEAALAEAVRAILRTTHQLAEPAGAAGLAGVVALGEALAGKKVGIVLSGGNLDEATLARIVVGAL
jgi:threonine dehydratase